jgi:hypothetical protein
MVKGVKMVAFRGWNPQGEANVACCPIWEGLNSNDGKLTLGDNHACKESEENGCQAGMRMRLPQADKDGIRAPDNNRRDRAPVRNQHDCFRRLADILQLRLAGARDSHRHDHADEAELRVLLIVSFFFFIFLFSPLSFSGSTGMEVCPRF